MSIEVRAEHISKTLNTTVALTDVSTVFEAGLVHGIVGPNGAGKTTLLRLIKGLLKPNKGTFNFTYRDKACTAQEAISRTGYFPQEPSLYPDLSVWEHLEFFRDLYDLDESDFHKRAEELLAATGMAPFKDRPAGKLSGGMYKKLGLMSVLGRSCFAPRVMGHCLQCCRPGNDRYFKHVLYGRSRTLCQGTCATRRKIACQRPTAKCHGKFTRYEFCRTIFET